MAGAYEESRKNSPSALPSYGAYKESRKGSPSALASNNPKKSKSVKPKNPDRSIKVSQSEINQIKKLGMKKSLEIAAGNRGSTYSGAVASFGEGVRRLYGDTRYQDAVYTPKASPGPSNFTYSTPKPKSNFTYQTGKSSTKASMASKPKAKSKNVAGFKPGSVGANVIGSLKKAYQGK
jgi:hypothetical protein